MSTEQNVTRGAYIVVAVIIVAVILVATGSVGAAVLGRNNIDRRRRAGNVGVGYVDGRDQTIKTWSNRDYFIPPIFTSKKMNMDDAVVDMSSYSKEKETAALPKTVWDTMKSFIGF